LSEVIVDMPKFEASGTISIKDKDGNVRQTLKITGLKRPETPEKPEEAKDED